MASQWVRQNKQSRSVVHKLLQIRRLSRNSIRNLSRHSRLRRVALVPLWVFFGGLALTACVDDVPELVSDDPVLQQGREIYVARCVSCHGPTGGGGLGAQLSDGEVVKNYPDIADQIDVVTNGKGTMAAFKDTLTEDEIEAVVRYTREGL